MALSIGIFAYVLRLLQAPAGELKPVLIYIWARILAVYETCKEDLLKQTYPPTRAVDLAPYTYFVNILHPTSSNQLPIPNVSEHRAMCAFILAVCCRDYRPGQVACLRVNVFESCLVHLRDVDPLLRQWSALCIAMMWDDFEEAKGLGVKARVHEVFCNLLHSDEVPEVRAAVMFALGTLLGTTGASDERKRFGRSIACSGPACGLTPVEQTDVELGVAMATLKSSSDGSPPVRRELIVLLSSIVNEHQGQFVIAAYRAVIDRVGKAAATINGAGLDSFASTTAGLAAAAESDEGPSNPRFQAAMFSCMYKTLFDLTADPQPDIAQLAQSVMDYILELLFTSPLGPPARAALRSVPSSTSSARVPPAPFAATVSRGSLQSVDQHAQNPHLHAGRGVNGHAQTAGIGGTIKRTASAMKSLAHATLLADPYPAAPSAQPPPPPSSLRLNGKVTQPSSTIPSPTGSLTPNALHSSPSTDSLRYLQSRVGAGAANRTISSKTGTRSSSLHPPGSNNSTSNGASHTDQAAIETIMAQLVAQDEDRLKKKRSVPSGPAAQTEQGVAAVAAAAAAAIAAGEGEQVLPLKGTFFDFALEYYKESQMRVS